MSATFNDEWLTWTVEASPKAFIHEQKMVEQKKDGISIPQIQLGTSQLEKEGRG